MPRSGPRTLYTYTDEFKQTAVRLSHQPGMQVKTVAAGPKIDSPDGARCAHAAARLNAFSLGL